MPAHQDEQTRAIIAAAMEVHNELGHGFLEGVYSNAMAIELSERGIPARKELPIPVYYKGVKLPCGYRADFLCFDRVIVEIKSQIALSHADEAQVLNYLRGTRCEVALLLNFGTPRLQIRRFILTAEYRATDPNPEIKNLC